MGHEFQEPGVPIGYCEACWVWTGKACVLFAAILGLVVFAILLSSGIFS